MRLNKNFSHSIIWRILCLALLTSSCRFLPSGQGPDQITRINIVDRSGLSETISSKERLGSFQKTDFLSPQPYQKVMRVYGRDKNGEIRSFITSYHPNGQVKQYLETINNRAKGSYREWYQNGQMKIDTSVIGGIADINTHAEESFLFEKLTRAWDEEGNLVADIPYEKGVLAGISRYYHKNGTLWKAIPYTNGLIDGSLEIYLEDSSLFSKTNYKQGTKEGLSSRYWSNGSLAYEEKYSEDRLSQAKYYDNTGKLIANISEGKGKRAIFGEKYLKQLQEYRDGIQEGLVEIYAENGNLVRSYSLKHGEKEGEEIIYHIGVKKPKLLLTWRGGVLQGPVKTWHENGQLESHKEMSQNKKHGLSTAWYPDGTLMLVEDYEDNTVIKGKYYQKGEENPVTTIQKGKGIATLFDKEGNLLSKIPYYDGKPQNS